MIRRIVIVQPVEGWSDDQSIRSEIFTLLDRSPRATSDKHPPPQQPWNKRPVPSRASEPWWASHCRVMLVTVGLRPLSQ